MAVALDAIRTARQPTKGMIRNPAAAARATPTGLQQRRCASAEAALDRLGHHAVTDGPLAADAQANQAAAEQKHPGVGRDAADQRAERVHEDRDGQERALAIAVGQHAGQDAADARGRERDAAQPRLSQVRDVQVGRDDFLDEAVQREVVEVEGPTEKRKQEKPEREGARHRYSDLQAAGRVDASGCKRAEPNPLHEVRRSERWRVSEGRVAAIGAHSIKP
jgi:hypothetical protein